MTRGTASKPIFRRPARQLDVAYQVSCDDGSNSLRGTMVHASERERPLGSFNQDDVIVPDIHRRKCIPRQPHSAHPDKPIETLPHKTIAERLGDS